MPTPTQTNLKKGAGYTALLLAMAAAATPVYQSWEGNKQVPYKDVIGVWTVCSGDTRGVNASTPKQTPEQCAERTKNILLEFGDDVAELNPSIVDDKLGWEAHSIFAANVGMGNYAKSSVLRLYKAGNYRQACRAMRLYDKAGGRVFQGLKNRREGTDNMVGEYELCLGGAIQKEYGE